MTKQAFKKMKEDVSKDVLGYCESYTKYCSVGIADDKISHILEKAGIDDLGALLGYLSVKVIAGMNPTWKTHGTFITHNIFDLCKESEYSDSTGDTQSAKIPLLIKLAELSNNNFYIAKGRIGTEAIKFLACVNLWKNQ